MTRTDVPIDWGRLLGDFEEGRHAGGVASGVNSGEEGT